MDRNLSRRVEVVFPIEQPDLKQRLIREILNTCLADNVKARELLPDGTYRRVTPRSGQPRVRSQELFWEMAVQKAAGKPVEVPTGTVIRPVQQSAREKKSRQRQRS
jgi:polyphosphate kinase